MKRYLAATSLILSACGAEQAQKRSQELAPVEIQKSADSTTEENDFQAVGDGRKLLFIHTPTLFKKSTVQSGQLEAEQFCEIPAGVYESTSATKLTNGHFRLDLVRKIASCDFQSGYISRLFASDPSRSITLVRKTWLKSSTGQSQNLDASQKCELPVGVYALTTAPSSTGRHLKVALNSSPDGCALTEGYFYQDHSKNGISAIELYRETWLKDSLKQADSIEDDKKCSLKPGTLIVSPLPTHAEAGHVKVRLVEAIEGCPLNAGYIWTGHTSFSDKTAKDPITEDPNVGTGKWSFPLTGGYLGSRWCVCRSIGTSPHIGQDIVKSSRLKSVAVYKGKVESISYNQSCGYFVYYRDIHGGLWRYVHLNKPNVSVGQRLNSGDLLGHHGAYPGRGCGTGPHLHLERRSSGAFKDSPKGRSCRNGYTTCYYDPIKPWRGGSFALIGTTDSPETEYEEETYVESECNGEQVQQIVVDQIPNIELAESQANLVLESSLTRDGRQFSGNVFIKDADNENVENICDDECLTRWSLYSRQEDGRYARILVDQSIRNRAVRIEKEQKLCLPDSSQGDYIIVAKTRSGRWLTTEGAW